MDISSLRERRSETAMTVTELNGYIKRLLENDRMLSAVAVKGEISNFINHRSGHLYFTLKDSDGQIKSVMFRSSAMRLKFMPENGMKVIVYGSVNIYSKDGSLQLYVNNMQPDGIGALYLAYEQLKERLYSEGLFDTSHKSAIPRIPKRVGVITSPTGAAIRDIINVLGRRFPYASVYLYPSLVQGDGAEENLIEAVDYFDKSKLVDVVIIGRGGGSLEDLWAFNSERLARRIYAATVPIISAVGHETDFTICDFVSDLRAPTPSAAAELAVPDIRELYMRISSLCDAAYQLIDRTLESKKIRFDVLRDSRVFMTPEALFESKRILLKDLLSSLEQRTSELFSDKRSYLNSTAVRADALSPLATLRRGYSVSMRDGVAVKSISELVVGDELRLVFYDGEATAEIKAKGSTNEKQNDL